MTTYHTYDTEYGHQNYFGNFTCFQKCILIILLLQFNQPMVFEKVYKFDKKVDFQHFCLFGIPLVGYWSTSEAYYFKRALRQTVLLFFQFFFGAFLHFKRYDHDVYMFLILQNIPERTVEADFLFEPSKKFFDTRSGLVSPKL